MKIKNRNKIQNILDNKSYWVESINGLLYDSIIRYMESNNMNQTQLAKYLGISKGRLSQILNNGESNFRIDNLIDISLKINKYPIFNLEEKEEFLKQRIEHNNIIKLNVDYKEEFSILENETVYTCNKNKIMSFNVGETNLAVM